MKEEDEWLMLSSDAKLVLMFKFKKKKGYK